MQNQAGDLKDGELLQLLKELESSPSITQRELSSRLGISLGKVNYIVKALIEKGFVKASLFNESNKKSAYFYVLTPHGLEEKAKITYRFLKRKMREYDQLKEEIEQLKKETKGRF